MALIIQKFGGTSVGNTKRIKEVALIVKSEIDKGNKVIVVVSAMSGTTNQLITFCNELSILTQVSHHCEYDAALSTGEMLSSALLTLALQSINLKARSISAWQLPIITNSVFNKALVESIDNTLLKECLDNGTIPVVSGFQGINKDKRLTTLGRGGSDTTASLLGASIKADRIDIYSDVKGVYSADPRIVANAVKLNILGYEEMLELSNSGAKVLHARSVEVAYRYNIPLRVLSSFTQINGTLITSKSNIMENRIITGISSNKNLLKASFPTTKINLNEFYDIIAFNNINIDYLLNMNNICNIIIDLSYKNLLTAIFSNFKINNKLEDFIINTEIALISLVGYGIKNDPTLPKKIKEILNKENIDILMLQNSDIKITILINEINAEKVVKLFHETLY